MALQHACMWVDCHWSQGVREGRADERAAGRELLTAAQLAYGVLSGQLGDYDGQHQRITERLQAALAHHGAEQGER